MSPEISPPPEETHDQLSPDTDSLAPERETVKATGEATGGSPEFHAALQKLAEKLPEIAERQETIRVRGGELIDEFGISPELFDDESYALLFSAIADRYATLENGREALSADEYDGEKGFIGDALMLLAREKSSHYDSVKEQIDTEPADSLEAAERERIYDRFTNQQMSEELTNAIATGGRFDELKKRLGVTPDNEDKLTVRVLNMANQSMLDLRPRPPAEADLQKQQEHSRAAAKFKSFAEGLMGNREEFLRSAGRRLAVGGAWVEHLSDGSKTLAVFWSTAQQILHPTETGAASDASEKELLRVMHEYTHAQGGILVGPFYNLSAEEFRAEYFPRRNAAYGDVKKFVIDLYALTGFDMRAHLDAHIKGGTAEEYLIALADKAGLQGALEVALMPPQSIVSSSPPLQQRVAARLGSFDAIGKRMYERAAQDPAKLAAIRERLDDWAKSWAQASELAVRNETLDRRNLYGLSFVTAMVEERAVRMRSAAEARDRLAS